MSKQTIFTGLRANNELHIGNYFGALLPLIDMAKRRADEFDVNLMVADLHSFTTPIDHSKLHDQIMANLRVYVAAGLPMDKPTIRVFRQSYVPAHSELAWVFDNFTGMGEFNRMTEFKDKSAKLGADRINVGLFNYPALMAADVLLYDAEYVPVGDDQRQHLEYMRDIAMRMNSQFKQDLFVVPKSVEEQHKFFNKDQGLRIRDLLKPESKMSKSDETGNGVIFLSDDPEVASKKIMSATTDGESKVGEPDIESRPGVANLLQILALLSPESSDKVAEISYKEFKELVAEEVMKFLSDFQKRLAEVNDDEMLKKIETDEAIMRELSGRTLLKVQKAIGLRSNA